MMCVNVFYITKNELDPIKMRNFPIDPHYKNPPLDMTLQKWAIFIMGVYGEILCLLSDPAEISFLVV